MRNITEESISAFNDSKQFKKQNMEVETNSLLTWLKLHGNIIAIKDNNTGLIKIKNCGWFSKTTKERLNALPGVKIIQKQKVWYLNGEQWDGSLIEIK